MKRVNEIRNNEKYQKAMFQIEAYESTRSYCQHGFVHQLDVARIAYIICLEQNLHVDKEVIYATALLHDIGRYLEYEGKMPHHEGSAVLAKEILIEVGYEPEEITLVVETILKHRNKAGRDNSTENVETNEKKKEFFDIFYEADKLSRNCFDCPVRETCKWTEEMINKEIII